MGIDGCRLIIMLNGHVISEVGLSGVADSHPAGRGRQHRLSVVHAVRQIPVDVVRAVFWVRRCVPGCSALKWQLMPVALWSSFGRMSRTTHYLHRSDYQCRSYHQSQASCEPSVPFHFLSLLVFWAKALLDRFRIAAEHDSISSSGTGPLQRFPPTAIQTSSVRPP